MTADLSRLLGEVGAVLLDFDGPVCSIFARYPAPQVAAELVDLLRRRRVDVPPSLASEPDPLEVLRQVDALGDHGAIRAMEDALCVAERRAAELAEPTPFGREVIVAARQAGMPVGVVSNNSAGAVAAYLGAHRLLQYVAPVVGRAYAEPARMKPNPEPIIQAVRLLGELPSRCVLVGTRCRTSKELGLLAYELSVTQTGLPKSKRFERPRPMLSSLVWPSWQGRWGSGTGNVTPTGRLWRRLGCSQGIAFLLARVNVVRLTKIAFHGFRRLVGASCNVDSKLVAFLGPNEAGKSSILQALDWWTRGKELEQRDLSRSFQPEPGHPVVSLTFILDDDDVAELGKRSVIAKPRTQYRVHRSVSGKRLHGFSPPLERDWSRNQKLAEQMRLDLQLMPPRESMSAVERMAHRKCFDLVQAALDKRDIGTARLAAIDLNPDEQAALSAHAPHLPKQFSQIYSMWLGSPSIVAREVLRPRLPELVLYKPEDRSLDTRYDLDDLVPPGHGPEPVVNLLALAEIDIAALAGASKRGDTSRVRTLLKSANARLRRKIQPAWQQKHLSLRLEVEGGELLILVDELDDDGSRTTIDERSDGLRAFLGMTCFVLAQKRSGENSPVILLADEIDRHLHFDAQADLISVLASQTEIQQVLYTTHSPGCLPPDLGTSVRLVEPNRDEVDRSVIRSSFWGTSAVGFSPLLVAMGAGAAAFSVCRKAVLAEGATEMILLPTLVRLATELAQLPYQVAPGLSSLRRDGFGLDEVSAKVAYLIDGDDGGEEQG